MVQNGIFLPLPFYIQHQYYIGNITGTPMMGMERRGKDEALTRIGLESRMEMLEAG